MCVSCLSNGEFVAMNAALAAGAVARGVGAMRASTPDERRLARDVRTVAFLRGLDLDPVAILGADAVRAADGAPARRAPSLVADAYARWRWALGAMRSQSLVSPQ
jgi:hypothetical protein